MDVARADTVDAELDKLISRRASQDPRPDPDEEHDLWREENRIAWCDYFGRLAGSLRARAEEYDQRAEALMKATEEGKTA